MDIVSYVIGLSKGKKEGASEVIIEGTDYTFTDENNDGNIVIEEDK